MKTAKEITEYLDKEYAYNDDMRTHLVLVHHEEGYWEKLKFLEMVREHLLKTEYRDQEKHMRTLGVQQAMEWLLEK